jgi:integrase
MTQALEPRAAGALVVDPGALATIGQIANTVAAGRVFDSYREGKAGNTTRRHAADLGLFAEFLAYTGAPVSGNLATEPTAWTGLTWGIVEAFKAWLIQQGYSIASVNARLSAVKTYAGLACKAGAVERSEMALIRSIRGFSHKEGRHIEENRTAARVGAKKAAWVSLSREQADRLKAQPDTPQGRRDSLLMCLMLDHGLRCGEVARLAVGDFNLKTAELVFYRPKVDLVQTHKLFPNALAAARAYLKQDAPAVGVLLRGSRKDGSLADVGMSEQAITARVKRLGELLGLDHLSAHDLRHYWATAAARSGTPVDRLQQAGGWTSPAMALRYIEQAEIANEGVKLE